MATSARYGISLRFQTEDAVGRTIYKTGTYEENLSSYLLAQSDIPDDGIFLDVGANIGWYSLLMAKYLTPSSRIFSFEPDTTNVSLLRENMKLNQCTNIHIANKALGKERGVATLYLYPGKNRGRHSLIDLDGNQDFIEVEVVSLDEYLEDQGVDFSKISLMKIDIEGFEYPAFQGAPKVLSSVPRVLAEFSPEYMKRGGFDPIELIELMESNGFQAHHILPNQLVPVSHRDLRESNEQQDLLWAKV